MKVYKKWLINLTCFNLILLLLFLICLKYVNKYSELRLLSHKEYLLEHNPEIIFGGDSRAESQLNPKIASDLLKIPFNKIVNIASPSGDLIMIENLIKRYPNKFKNSTIIVSVSPHHLNDAVTKHGYFTYTTISKLSLFEQLKIFSFNNFDTLKYYYTYAVNRFFSDPNLKRSNSKNNGFLEVDKILNTKDISTKISWYKTNDDYYGYKYKIFLETLQYIKKNVKKIYLYTGFFAPIYVDVTKNSHQNVSEKKFQTALKEICKSSGVDLITNNNFSLLDNKHFSDAAHLNKYGAEVFTELIINKIKKINKENLNQ